MMPFRRLGFCCVWSNRPKRLCLMRYEASCLRYAPLSDVSKRENRSVQEVYSQKLLKLVEKRSIVISYQ